MHVFWPHNQRPRGTSKLNNIGLIACWNWSTHNGEWVRSLNQKKSVLTVGFGTHIRWFGRVRGSKSLLWIESPSLRKLGNFVIGHLNGACLEDGKSETKLKLLGRRGTVRYWCCARWLCFCLYLDGIMKRCCLFVSLHQGLRVTLPDVGVLWDLSLCSVGERQGLADGNRPAQGCQGCLPLSHHLAQCLAWS